MTDTYPSIVVNVEEKAVKSTIKKKVEVYDSFLSPNVQPQNHRNGLTRM